MTKQEYDQLCSDVETLIQKLQTTDPQDATVVNNLLQAYRSAEDAIESFVKYTIDQEGDEETAAIVLESDVLIEPDIFEKYLLQNS